MADHDSSNRSPAAAIVIPTCNRASILLQSLRHLAAQTFLDFEVIIVDDGSSDDTRAAVARFQSSAPFPIQYLHQPNSGPARARNRAFAAVRAPLAILIGDDIFPDPDFVALHIGHHRLHPELEAVAVGRTRWSEQGQIVTPFMRWLDRDGAQFAYGDLDSGVPAGWKHFYTSNLSAKTAYLCHNPFDEGFPRYGLEDIELGYRLAHRHGLRMSYLPAARAAHLHPTDFSRCCLRYLEIGAAEHRFQQLWPELRQPLSRNPLRRLIIALLSEQRFVLPLLRRAAGWLTDRRCPNPLILPLFRLHRGIGFRRAAARARLT